jgi:tetratricopeptide (TPR) repeat protein
MSLESTSASPPPPGSVPAKTPRTRGRRVPVLTVALAPVVLDVLLISAFLALVFLLGAFPLKDTDFWWHLRTGDLVRQTRQVPQTDLFTFAAADHPWIDLHWGYQVALSWGFARGGVVALTLAKCAITTAALFLLIMARRRHWPVWVMVLAWLPALLVLGGRMYIRPETLTLLYLAIDLAIIFRWDRFPLLALLLPVVQVAWVNSQGLFVLGPVLLACALLDALLRPGSLARERRHWWRIVGVATFLTGLACLVNPYGLRGAFYPLQLARTMSNPLFSRTIAELWPIPLFVARSAGWRNLHLQLHITTMVLGALSFLVPLVWMVLIRGSKEPEKPAKRAKKTGRGRARGAGAAGSTAPPWRLSPLRLLLFGAFSFLSWQATRNSHQFAAVVGTLTAWNFGEWAAAVHQRRSSENAPVPSSGVVPRLLALGAITVVFLLVASGKFYAMAGEGRTIGLGEEPLWFPHEAVEFAGGADMPRRFLGFHEGYAALYEYHHGPGRKVFIDARLEVIGPDLYERYIALQDQIKNGDPSWVRVLESYQQPAVMAGHATSADVGAAILANPAWRCVWFDPIVAVFIHQSYAAAVAAHRVDFAARHFAPDPASASDPQGIDALLATAEALWKYATSLEARGRTDLARPLVLLGLGYARGLRQVLPESRDGWKLVGKLESAREPLSASLAQRFRQPFDPVFDLAAVTATYNLGRALELAPSDFLTLRLLERLFAVRAMNEAAVLLLERLVQTVPINQLQAGEIDVARSELAQLRSRLGPESPASWENLSALETTVTALLAHGRVHSAAEFLERAYPDAPRRSWEVSDRLATLRLHLGEPARARRFWETAATPPRPALRAARVAATYLVEGAFDAARQHYRAALAEEPDLFEASYGLAVLEQDAGNAAEALTAARAAATAARGDVARSAAATIVTLVGPYAGEESSPRGRGRGRGRGPSPEVIRMKFRGGENP